MLIGIDNLPPGVLDPLVLTVVCDPEPSQALPVGEASQLYCGDTARLGVRAMATVTDQPVSRIYLRRPVCPAIPCLDVELDTATLTAWTAAGPYSVPVDIRLLTIPAPIADLAAPWPSLNIVAPPTQRPPINGAPSIVARRAPYPFCGTTIDQGPPEIANCFLSAVLDARPAEMVERTSETEGGTTIWIYRYDGFGAIHAFISTERRWLRVDGGLIINPGAQGWSFDAWDDQTSLS